MSEDTYVPLMVLVLPLAVTLASKHFTRASQALRHDFGAPKLPDRVIRRTILIVTWAAGISGAILVHFLILAGAER
jgi:hypothetical protein